MDRIMLAVGGNTVDPETTRLACRIGKPDQAKLYAIHVIEVNRSLPLGAMMEAEVEKAEHVLDEVERIAAEFELPVETELIQARDPGAAIVAEAEEWEAAAIVMGLPYKRRFGEFDLGRTVPHVLKNANCRVILFRERRTS
jgi:nucleotide-binding universal stress UspA family protein